jgi:hypothetical protein
MRRCEHGGKGRGKPVLTSRLMRLVCYGFCVEGGSPGPAGRRRRVAGIRGSRFNAYTGRCCDGGDSSV